MTALSNVIVLIIYITYTNISYGIWSLADSAIAVVFPFVSYDGVWMIYLTVNG